MCILVGSRTQPTLLEYTFTQPNFNPIARKNLVTRVIEYWFMSGVACMSVGWVGWNGAEGKCERIGSFVATSKIGFLIAIHSVYEIVKNRATLPILGPCKPSDSCSESPCLVMRVCIGSKIHSDDRVQVSKSSHSRTPEIEVYTYLYYVHLYIHYDKETLGGKKKNMKAVMGRVGFVSM